MYPKQRLVMILSFATLALAACASMPEKTVPVRTANDVLTSESGMTLYTFDRDVVGSGKSVCNGQCAINWPPLLLADGVNPNAPYSVVVRDDGKRQVAVNGKPLYLWAKDAKPGDKTGDGFNNVWRVAKP
jgi:predicted lipoprotein with Yx(FWY)xxD motif